MNHDLKPATNSDYGFAWQLYREAAIDFCSRHSNDEWNDDIETARFKGMWSVCTNFVVIVDGQSVGWISCSYKPNGDCVVENGGILTEHRSKGIAEDVLVGLAEANKEKQTKTFISTEKESSNEQFYRKAGFEVSSSQDQFTQMEFIK
ncbi:MAG: GNAT family N-acetyltransferase [Pseudomonadota bacterium]